jgi:hypothetical protein
VGTGGPLEAPFTLLGPIDAGTWHIVADGIVIDEVDVLLELVWRHGGLDQPIASFQHHFVPLASGFDAQPFEATAAAAAVPATSGDQLVFRYSVVSGATRAMAWIPNGDGARANGRDPFIELPP